MGEQIFPQYVRPGTCLIEAVSTTDICTDIFDSVICTEQFKDVLKTGHEIVTKLSKAQVHDVYILSPFTVTHL
jgi:hypothetical protein